MFKLANSEELYQYKTRLTGVFFVALPVVGCHYQPHSLTAFFVVFKQLTELSTSAIGNLLWPNPCQLLDCFTVRNVSVRCSNSNNLGDVPLLLSLAVRE